MLGFRYGSRDSRSPHHPTSTIITPLVLNVAPRCVHRSAVVSTVMPLFPYLVRHVGPLLRSAFFFDV